LRQKRWLGILRFHLVLALPRHGGIWQRAVNRIAGEHAPLGRGTVGCVDVYPNSRNVIPGQVKLTVDFRNADDAGLREMDAALRAACTLAAREGNIEVDVNQVVSFAPQPFAPVLIDSVRRAAQSLGYTHLDLPSGAAHDAVYVARVAPTAMIFVPCKDGISHNEIEYASPAHLEAGANTLLAVMVEQAGA
jgi:N-carbamoyl-L-amino-acid hydrolase